MKLLDVINNKTNNAYKDFKLVSVIFDKSNIECTFKFLYKNEISDDEDDVKVFVPEVPSESEEDKMFASFEEVDINDPVFNEETAPAEDFEIDFSMFEVDEAKKQAREAEKANNHSSRKKKKKKR